MSRGFLDEDTAQADVEDHIDRAGEIKLTGTIGKRCGLGLRFNDGVRDVVIPLSLIRHQELFDTRGTGTVTVPEWFAKEKKLI